MELIFAFVMACAVGILVGFMPSVNITVGTTMCLPFLLGQTPVAVLTFYITLIVICQYLGSVSALALGIPGEANSMPAVAEAQIIRPSGSLTSAIRNTALGSMLGSITAVALLIIIYPVIQFIMLSAQTEIKLCLLALVLVLMSISSNNRCFITVTLIACGLMLGAVGRDNATGIGLVLFDNTWLSSGIPFIVVIVCLYAVPLLLKSVPVQISDNNTVVTQPPIPLKFLTVARSSVIGFVAGVIPVLSFGISSVAAWLVEKHFYKTSSLEHSHHRLLAAETANNSASLSALIPLIMFGVPIIASEAVIYQVLAAGGQHLGPGLLLDKDFVFFITLAFLLANVAGLIMAWPLARTVTKLSEYMMGPQRYIIVFALISLMLYEGYTMFQLSYFSILAAVLLPIGLALMRFDTMPLIFGYFLSDILQSIVTVIIQKYF
jgi:putative tricarboxylic transport membrane protein